MSHFIFKGTDGTPDSPVNAFIFFTIKLWQCWRKKPVIDDDLLKDADLPYIVLANHECFEDFYYLHMLSHPRNPAYVINRYYCSGPFTGWLRKHVGFIPKKLFVRDTVTIFGIKRMLRKGYPVIIYPEGRLSPDGCSNSIVEKSGRLLKKLGADIVLAGIDGGYYAHPKWRKKAYPSDVRVTVKRVLKRSELASMSFEDIDRVIEETLYNDASLSSAAIYHQKNKAEGLEGILYRCADCGALYKTSGKGNELRCMACGAVHTLDDSYHFTDKPWSIPGYYSVIREMEEKEINALSLKAEVTLKVFDDRMKVCKKEDGICTLDKDYFRYRSDTEDFSIPTEKLPALAFSCSKEFELYHNDRLHYFYPKEDPVQAARWALAVDILTSRRNGGKNEQGE